MHSAIEEVMKLKDCLVRVDGELGVPLGDGKYSVCSSSYFKNWISAVIAHATLEKQLPLAAVTQLTDKDRLRLEHQINVLKMAEGKTDRYLLRKVYEDLSGC